MPKDFLNLIVDEVIRDVGEKITNRSVKTESYVVQSKTFTSKTETLSEKNRKNHQELMERYVKALNEISAKLDSVDREDLKSTGSTFKSLKNDEVYNLNASFLHGLFFENIGDPSSKLTTDSLTFMRIERDWGTFDKWQKDFIACCMSPGNGWAVMCYNTFLKRYINVIIDSHSANVPIGCIPIIVLDCWEHSYYTDYLSDRKEYVFSIMREFRWDKIEERIENAEQIGRVLK